MLELSPLDLLIVNFDQGLRTVFGQPPTTMRPHPSESVTDVELTASEKRLSSRLMRVNHAGEVATQALYQGQALTARTEEVYANLRQSAQEENDHLVWCKERIQELGGHVSLLNPLWYTGSLTIGTLAGIAGDKWSLGFVAETEHQVVAHLERYIHWLPVRDQKSRAILQQMQIDEERHATVALETGGVALPPPVRWLMKQTANVMTRVAFWL